MEQRCYLWAVWLTWLGLPALAILVGLRLGWVAGGLFLLGGIVGSAAYVRWFPRFSRWVGYGSVADTPAAETSLSGPLQQVTLYSANVCPFCPIVKRRLTELRQRLGFELQVVDVTFRPDLISEKGLRSVPTVEANGRFLLGNATSDQLSAFLRQAASAEPG
jgi:glutaredoxin